MSIAKERRDYIIKEMDNKKNNILNGIPLYYTFPKIASVIPTIQKGYPILWTSGSGMGKTQTWMGIILYSIYKLRKLHPELNVKIKLVIALLEDPKEMFIDRLYSMLLFDMFKLVVPYDELHSMRENPLSDDIASKLEQVEKEIDFILEECEINDYTTNPTGIYKWARSISNKLGTHKMQMKSFSEPDGREVMKEVYSHYEPHDPDLHVVMIVDNLNNLSQETKNKVLLDDRKTINLWTSEYCRLQITKHWRWSVINIIQQSAEGSSLEYDRNGKPMIQKLKPSVANLGNSKECARDAFLIIGLFAPSRYGINVYEGYPISELGDSFRSLIIIKSNISRVNEEIPLYFNGACLLVRELPIPAKLKEFKP